MLSKNVKNVILGFVGFTTFIPVQFIGLLRVGEITLLFFFLLSIINVINIIRTEKVVRVITVLFVLSIVVSLFSSFLFKNGSEAILKGVANYLFMYTSLFSMYILIKNNENGLLVYFLALSIGSTFYNPYLTIRSEYNLDRVYGTASYFDILVAPVVTPLLLGLSFLKFKFSKYVFWGLFLSYGVIAVLNDARSVGFIFLLASLAFLVKNINAVPSLNKLRLIILFSPIIIIPLFIFFVKNGLVGKESSQYTESLMKTTKTFNPFLLVGRPDPIVGLIAFYDKPLTGHGYNSDNPKYIFMAKVAGLLPKNFKFEHDGMIPSHSVLVNGMVEGGILCSFLWIFILGIGIKGLWLVSKVKYTNYTFFVLYAFFSLFWNILFSPAGYARFGMPSELSIIILVLYKFRT